MERFWSKVNIAGPDECWEWQGADNGNGYGTFYFRERYTSAHRTAYRLEVGEIPDGLVIDHLCRNKSCCNPAHLEAVTQRENVQRGAALITHCPAGHEYDEQNTRFKTNSCGNLSRDCRACDAARGRAKRRQAREMKELAHAS